MAVLDSPWTVLEDCQRNKAEKINDDVTMLQTGKIGQTPFSTVLRDLSWDQGEDLGLAITVLDRP